MAARLSARACKVIISFFYCGCKGQRAIGLLTKLIAQIAGSASPQHPALMLK